MTVYKRVEWHGRALSAALSPTLDYSIEGFCLTSRKISRVACVCVSLFYRIQGRKIQSQEHGMKKQGFLLRWCRYRERIRTRVKTAHASILCAIKGIPREREIPLPMDLLRLFLLPILRIPSLSIWEKSSSRKEDRNRWASKRRREKSFSSADAG